MNSPRGRALLCECHTADGHRWVILPFLLTPPILVFKWRVHPMQFDLHSPMPIKSQQSPQPQAILPPPPAIAPASVSSLMKTTPSAPHCPKLEANDISHLPPMLARPITVLLVCWSAVELSRPHCRAHPHADGPSSAIFPHTKTLCRCALSPRSFSTP
jgi:hypothetical protein